MDFLNGGTSIVKDCKKIVKQLFGVGGDGRKENGPIQLRYEGKGGCKRCFLS